MGVIKENEIMGYKFGNEIVCLECTENEESEKAKKDEILTGPDIDGRDGQIYFCDRCTKRMVY